MKFSKVVAEARKRATNYSYLSQVVYQNLDAHWWNSIPKYDYCDEIDFRQMVKTGQYALIRLLLIYPNGTIVQ